MQLPTVSQPAVASSLTPIFNVNYYCERKEVFGGQSDMLAKADKKRLTNVYNRVFMQ
jgi:hypothetical protein